ncbi:MAG: bacteriohemerythrin [Magnetospirillum sp. WYHS-4]
MPWSEAFSLGIRVLDNDHRQLFDIINSLHDAVHRQADQKMVGAILDALVSYAESHFEREEGYQERCGYPRRIEHGIEHKRFTGVVYGLKRQYERTPETVVGRDVLAFLKAWLEKHILVEDMAFVPYLRGEKGGSARSPAMLAAGAAQVAVNETVPADKAEMLRRCAEILREGGYPAFVLEELLRKG